MFSIILLFSFIAILSFLLKKNGTKIGLRELFLKTAVIFGFLLVSETELLSLFKALTFTNLLVFWCIITAIFSILSLSTSRSKIPVYLFRPPAALSFMNKFYLSSIIFICFIVMLTAYFAPPNTFDSMTYHMTRVAHWAQDKGVFNYPTKGLRQLAYNPGAEYILLNTYVLSRGDVFVNLLQWFCMLGCIIGTSLIAKELGASKKGQIYTSLLTATIPMGILQASGTQNDYVASFWLICLIYFLMRCKKDLSWVNVFFASASFGLGILTKGTVYIFSFSFLIWILLNHIKNVNLKTLGKFLAFIIIALILNIGFYIRNYDLGRHPLTPVPVSQNLTNESLGIKTLTSNLIRNAALHLDTPFKGLNSFFENSVIYVHKVLNINVNDPKTTFGGGKFFIPDIPLHEDHAGNLLHLIYGIISIVLFFMLKGQKRNKLLLQYIIVLLSSFLLFSLFLKWQPWNNRLQLPLFVAFCPFMGVVIANINNKWISHSALIILIIFSMPRVFKNSSRRTISSKGTIFNTKRIDQYFSNNEGLKGQYKEAVNYIASINCRKIGYSGHGETWEYPFWPLLKEKIKDFRLESVNANNESSKYSENIALDNFMPCAIIKVTKKDIKKINFDENNYIKVKDFGEIDIFVKDADGKLEKKNLLLNYNKTMSLTDISTSGIVDKRPFETFGQRELDKIIYYKNEIEAAELVDTNKLNEIYPGLGDHFKNELLPGIKLRAFGYINLDETKYKYGYALLLRWQKWKEENIEGIKKAFDSL